MYVCTYVLWLIHMWQQRQARPAHAERAAELKISKYSGLEDVCLPANCSGVAWSTQWDSLSVFEGSRENDLRPVRWRERSRECIPVPKVICCHSAIQRYLAPQQFWGGRPAGLMVIPAFTFSNYFFLALGIGDALGTKNNNKVFINQSIASCYKV